VCVSLSKPGPNDVSNSYTAWGVEEHLGIIFAKPRVNGSICFKSKQFGETVHRNLKMNINLEENNYLCKNRQ